MSNKTHASQSDAADTRAHDPEFEVLFSASEISARIQTMAQEIADSRLERVIVVAILTGSFIFAADLLRALHALGVKPEVDFVTLSSYRTNTVSSGSVQILRDIDMSLEGRDVLLIDDILESGRTLAFAKDLLTARGARTVATCVLLEKDVPRAVAVEADFKAFQCGNDFVVGYGMDLAYRFRELPFVGRVVSEGS